MVDRSQQVEDEVCQINDRYGVSRFRQPRRDDTPDRLNAERFRQPAPVIDLTPQVIADLRRLLDDAQRVASVTGLPWRSSASGGKPLLHSRGACIAFGTIGSWNEIDLAVAAVNALPALLAALDDRTGIASNPPPANEPRSKDESDNAQREK